MLNFTHTLFTALAALVGFFFLSVAFFLYEDEQGRVRSKLADLWIRVDDLEGNVLTRHTAFVTQVAQFETRMLNKV
jgi:hypothetical protein